MPTPSEPRFRVGQRVRVIRSEARGVVEAIEMRMVKRPIYKVRYGPKTKRHYYEHELESEKPDA